MYKPSLHHVIDNQKPTSLALVISFLLPSLPSSYSYSKFHL